MRLRSDVAWVLSAPTRASLEPTWPKCAYFRAFRSQEWPQMWAPLHAITRENPLRPAKLLKRKDRGMAERVGFEPTCRLRDKTLSRRPRYDHFGTSPQYGRTIVYCCLLYTSPSPRD